MLNRFDDLLDRYINHRNIFDKTSPPKNLSTLSSNFNQGHTSTAHGTEPSPSSEVRASSDRVPIVTEPPVTNTPSLSNTDTVDTSPSARIFVPSQLLVFYILSVTHRLVRSSSHDTRHVYNSIEHISALLSDDSPAVILQCLEILNVLLQRYHKFRSSRVTITPEISDRLVQLALGWGGRENSLGLLECCSQTPAYQLSPLGKRLLFEYKKAPETSPSNANMECDDPSQNPNFSTETSNRRLSRAPSSSSRSSNPSPILLPHSPPFIADPPANQVSATTMGNTNVIYMPDAGAFEGSEHWLLYKFAQRNGVPKGKWFSLLCAFRRAKAFSEGRSSRAEAALIRLSALTTLLQLQPLPSMIEESLVREPELIQDIVGLIRGDSQAGLDGEFDCLCTTAIRCISAMLVDRQRINPIINAIGGNQHHGILPTMLRTEVSALLDGGDPVNDANEPAKMDITASDSPSTHGLGPNHLASITENRFADFSSLDRLRYYESMLQVSKIDALLALVHGLATTSGSTGATALANSGVLAILVPLMSDHDARHLRVIAQTVRTIQAIIEGSAQAIGCQLFRDQDGLSLVAERIALEVGISEKNSLDDLKAEDEAVEEDALKRRGESKDLYDVLARKQMTPEEALEHHPPSSSGASRGLLSHSKWALLRALHQLLTVSLGSGGSEVRELIVNSKLPMALRKTLGQPFKHGGSLFNSAAVVATDIAHAEPTATAELMKAGIAHAVLRSVNSGLPPCAEAIRCVPSLLAALCLAPTARELVVNSSPLRPYLLRLATPFYARAMHGETPLQIGNSVDELVRHVEALRAGGNDAMLDYLRMSATFVESDTSNISRAGTKYGINSKFVEGDGDDVLKRTRNDSGTAWIPGGSQPESAAAHPNVVVIDKMKLAVANNSCRLAGFAQGSLEHQSGIVSNGGLDHMLKLLLAPALACDETSVRDSHSYVRHYPTPAMTVAALITSLRNFSSRHGDAVLRSLFSVVFQDATTALKLCKSLDDRLLPEEDDRAKVASSLNAEGAHSSKDVERDIQAPSSRKGLRSKLELVLRKLRVEVIVLAGLSRGGPGSSSAVAWMSAGGSEAAAALSSVERIVRVHLAKVYTGLTLSAGSDGDLTVARVSATADPRLRPIRPEHLTRVLGDVSKVVGVSLSKNKRFEEICKRYEVPPEAAHPVRQQVKGLAWQMVTFAVAAQRLYSVLSRGLTLNSRRHSREGLRSSVGEAKSLASSLGRIFALHLKATAPLWTSNVITISSERVVAAWDYIRGILIEIKGTIFDDSRSGTQSLLLKSFLEAGGGEALAQAVRPSSLLEAASPYPVSDDGNDDSKVGSAMRKTAEIEEVMKRESLTASSFVLAVSDFLSELNVHSGRRSESRPGHARAQNVGDESSTDSVITSARVLSRLAVAESESRPEQGLSKSDLDFRNLLMDRSRMAVLRQRVHTLSQTMKRQFCEYAVRRVAVDAWHTLWSFLHMMALCPGLSTAVNDPSSSSDSWSFTDIRRTSLATVLHLTEPLTKCPRHIFSVYSHEGTALADMLGIVKTTSSNFTELSQKSTSRRELGNMDDWEDFLEPQEDTPSSRPLSPDPALVSALVDMGFSERRARAALRHTPGGLQFATEWLLSGQDTGNSSGSDREDAQWNPGAGGASNIENADNEQNNNNCTGNDDADNGEVAPNFGGEDDDDDDGDDDDGDDDGDDDDDDEGEGDEEEDDDDDDANNAVDEAIRVLTGNVDTDNNTRAIISHRIPPTELRIHPSRGIGIPEGSVSAAARVTTTIIDNSASVAMRSQSGRGSNLERPVSRSGLGRIVNRASDTATTTNVKISMPPKSSSTTKFVDVDGSFLLTHSVLIDLNGLEEVLEDAKFDHDEIQSMRHNWLNYVGGLGSGLGGGEDLKKMSRKFSFYYIDPTTVERFKHRKKQLFDSLVVMTKEVINQSISHYAGSHLPHIAAELFSALNKDGCMSSEDIRSICSKLADVLPMILSFLDGKAVADGAGLTGQTVSLLAHYGGWKSRNALANSEVFDLAFALMQGIVDDWIYEESVTEEASEPIEKLTITEENHEETAGSKWIESRNDTSVIRKSESQLSRESPVRVPTKEEVVKLSQLTTCMLLLDSHVRHRRKDDLLENVHIDTDGKQEAITKQPIQDESKPETMETDVAAINGINRNASVNENLLPQREESSSVARDEVNSEGQDVRMNNGDDGDTLEKHREEANSSRAELLDETKRRVWDAMNINRNAREDTSRLDRTLICQYTLKVLKLLKRIECGDAIIAVLQLLGSLTREWDVTEFGIKEGIVDLLLGLPHLGCSVRSVDCRIVRKHVRTILRHVLEDEDTLLEGMISEIKEVASGPLRTPRSSRGLKSLIESTAPLAARDITCYIKALHSSVMASGRDRTSHFDIVSQKTPTRKEVEAKVEKRQNVQQVVRGLCELTVVPSMRDGGSDSIAVRKPGVSSANSTTAGSYDLIKFALKTLAEMVEISRVAALAFVMTGSPSTEVFGSALDYLVQKLLPLGLNAERGGEKAGIENVYEAQDISKQVEQLFFALCSKGAGAHADAVDALAKAVRIEAEKGVANGGVLRGVSRCLGSGTRSRVLKAVLNSSMGNDMARCLNKLDVEGDTQAEVCKGVLKSLSMISQAATHMARQNVGDDVLFAGRSSNGWMEFNDREEFLVI